MTHQKIQIRVEFWLPDFQNIKTKYPEGLNNLRVDTYILCREKKKIVWILKKVIINNVITINALFIEGYQTRHYISWENILSIFSRMSRIFGREKLLNCFMGKYENI